MINIGMRPHDLGKQSVESLANKIGEKGFNCIQLALKKAVADFDYNNGMMSPGMAQSIKETFYKKGIRIAVLGCYVNVTHPDDIERGKLIDRFKEHIRFVRDFGCSIVGTETGSLNGDYSYNDNNGGEEAFERFMDTLKILNAEAEKFGVIVAIEIVKKHIINTPQRMKRVLDTINSNNVQVIFDAVNLLDAENYQEQDELIKESFELFGDRIIIIHAKDFVIENNDIKVVPPGQGLLNYALLMKLVKERKPYIDVLIENCKEEYMVSSKKFIEDLYAKV
ncbi:sugar phosphate isomerase/epimerase [Natranaerovirga pectinivora]|uniref:Sugar phosphate isomerase/epimerase n=1 Tax=Natranaerovirga pectinivora TaxID=682400 RepID=A0A4R3ML95_9FIRM|nr:sugar phosphate isomerase/epimerase [Natranaerovirga pectinivora]